MATVPDPTTMTVRDLRRRWKPIKERLVTAGDAEALRIRIHRACSWLARIEALEPDAIDTALVFRWIALNSLYGIWDDKARQPAGDGEALDSFLSLVGDLDRDGVVQGVLDSQRRLVLAILGDEYLNRAFWDDPSEERGRGTSPAGRHALTWYHERQYGTILDRLMDRIHFLRCQLVHGGATLGGQLNRTVVRRCATMLGHLLPAILVVMIDHGVEEDWGRLCYPPVKPDGVAGK